MQSEYLIPPGFKDNVSFDAYIEHEYKNNIINYFRSNGFDLVKTPLIEYSNNKNNNSFLITKKKNEINLKIRNDITPQIIRIVSSRLIQKIRPLKLCYYGEVVRKKGTMLRPERQFLQVGAETIGSKSVKADIEIINLAYQSLSMIGINQITIELSSRIFLKKLFNIVNNSVLEKNLIKSIKSKDLNSCYKFLNNDDQKNLLSKIFKCTGKVEKINNNLDSLVIDSKTKEEINNIRSIVSTIKLNKSDQINIDLSEINEKKYHDGIKFTFFAKDIRGEIANGGRYTIKHRKNNETATGFTCFMDTVLRASSFENIAKKVLLSFNTDNKIKNDLIKEGYVLFSIFENSSDLKKDALKFGCNYYLENKIIKEI